MEIAGLTMPPVVTCTGLAFIGFMGTAISNGGPPMALVCKDGDPLAMRATLAGYFSIGALMICALSVSTLILQTALP